MADVMINVWYHRPVGAFMTALARAPQAERPATVEAFMTLAAAYFNAVLLNPDALLDPSRRSPDLPTSPPKKDAGQVVAEFVPDLEGDAGAEALGRWRVHPYLEIAHIRRSAALDLLNHRPERVAIRLPEPHLLADAEREAAILSQATGADRMTGPSYYYDYISDASPRSITTMEYFWSRIADYTTSSCR